MKKKEVEKITLASIGDNDEIFGVIGFDTVEEVEENDSSEE